jgi:hypothetical protein
MAFKIQRIDQGLQNALTVNVSLGELAIEAIEPTRVSKKVKNVLPQVQQILGFWRGKAKMNGRAISGNGNRVNKRAKGNGIREISRHALRRQSQNTVYGSMGQGRKAKILRRFYKLGYIRKHR